MQSEFDSDAYDSDEFDREGNRLHYEEDYDSDRLVIDEDSEYHDQRKRKTPEAREDNGNQQYMEGYDNGGFVLDYSSDDESVFERNMANSIQRQISPPLQEVRQVDEAEEAMDRSGENAPGSPVEIDLMHLAPMHVEETADWPKPIGISNVRLRRNENFGGDWKEEMRDVNSNHYKTKDHFVWTNQLVVGRGVELDAGENWLNDNFRNKMKIINNPQIQRLPENTFSLKKAKDFGKGLFAKCFIEKDTVIGEYTGELITEEEERRRINIYNALHLSSYIYETEKPGLLIDAGPMGNHTRFINHSCNDDNCAVFMEIIDGVPKIWVVAIKDIQQGQELFLNYGKSYFENLECLCKGENCVEIEKESKRLKKQKWMNFY